MKHCTQYQRLWPVRELLWQHNEVSVASHSGVALRVSTSRLVVFYSRSSTRSLIDGAPLVSYGVMRSREAKEAFKEGL